VEFFKLVQEDWETAYVNTYGLNQGQMLSIPFIAVGIFMMIRAYRIVPGEKI
jgi:prolipoprotein diacylglyceryltransferase